MPRKPDEVIIVVETDFGRYPAPPEVAEAFRLAPKRKDGEVDCRFRAGRELEQYALRVQTAAKTAWFLKTEMTMPRWRPLDDARHPEP